LLKDPGGVLAIYILSKTLEGFRLFPGEGLIYSLGRGKANPWGGCMWTLWRG